MCGGSGSTVLAVLVISGCSTDATAAAAPSPTTASPTPSPTPTPTPTPKPTPRPAPPAVNPLTGLRGRTEAAGRSRSRSTTPRTAGPRSAWSPPTSSTSSRSRPALTRLAAVFASRQPSVVGPVRSVRNSDPELLATYGQPGAGVLRRRRRARRPCCGTRRWSTPDRSGRGRSTGGSAAGPRRTTSWWTRPRWPAGCRASQGRGTSACAGRDSDPRLATARKVGAVSVTVGRNRLGFRLGRAVPPLAAAGPRRRGPPHRLRPTDLHPQPGRPVQPGPHRPDRRRRAGHPVGLHVHGRQPAGCWCSGTAGC